MENKTIYIGDNELIVGERGTKPQATPTYPELCCHTLEDLDLINSREKISFKVSEDVKKVQQEEIIPYWENRSMRQVIFNNMDQKWHDCYSAGIFTEFMEQRAPGHTVGGSNIYKFGMLDLISQADNRAKTIDYENDPSALTKKEQLRAMRTCAEALISFAERYAKKAETLAESELSMQRKEELLNIASVCRHVPANSPRNFREALQHYWFIHLGVITELNTWDSFCPGRLDQHLNPFYKAGLQDGSLDKERARELLECFWIKFNNQPAPPKVGVTLKESGTYTDFCNINLGGLEADGKDGVNEITYLLLEVIDEMRLLQPSTNIQVSKKSPDLFIKEAGKVIREGWGQPSVFNADAVVQELLAQGKTLSDARQGGTSGCVETGAFGKESYILTGYFNLTKVLEVTLNRGVDPVSGKQLGPDTGDPRSFKSYNDLIEAYKQQLKYFIEIKIAGNQVIEKLYAENMPAPFLSLIIDDCLANARDYNAGGARYNSNYIQGVGIGSLTDSFTALKKYVFEDKRFSMNDILETLAANYSNHESIRHFLLRSNHRYGNDDDYADSVMQQLFSIFHDLVDGRKSVRGATYHINMLPTTCHVYFGSVIGATPDGRLAGMPLSEGISPVQGADVKGPTAVIKSASKMDHLKTGGTLLNMKFSPGVLSGQKGLLNLVHLVRAYFRMDGHHIQFNVVNAQTLREARLKPELHRNLIVRVAGYSDYFNNLSEQLQDEIIARTEHGSF